MSNEQMSTNREFGEGEFDKSIVLTIIATIGRFREQPTKWEEQQLTDRVC